MNIIFANAHFEIRVDNIYRGLLTYCYNQLGDMTFHPRSKRVDRIVAKVK